MAKLCHGDKDEEEKVKMQANTTKEIYDTFSAKVDGYLRLQHPVFSQLFPQRTYLLKSADLI